MKTPKQPWPNHQRTYCKFWVGYIACHVRPQDKLKSLYLAFHETYDHHMLPAGDLLLVAPTHRATRFIDLFIDA